jgi:Ni/Co efflux regulator RcnB
MPKLTPQSGKFILSAVVLLAVTVPASAYADNDKGRGHGKAHVERDYDYDRDKHHNGRKDDDVWVPLSILTDDRTRIEHYWQDDYKRHCPPGLAKKRNGCQPPGLAKKYRAGERLPDGIFIPLPDDLLSVLQPPPRGHQYVRVDRDVYLIT